VVAIVGAFTLAVTLLIAPAGAIVPAHSKNVWAPFSTVLAAYGPVFYTRNRRTGLLVVAILALLVARVWQPSITVITIGLLRTTVGPLIGLYFSAWRRLILALTERAERAERERHLLAGQARTEERARLAGEMHDVVTHRVSLMVLQAGALRVTAPDDATRQAAESSAVGTPAELIEEGDPSLASPVVKRTVYRVVREALTNVRKHAPGARVAVRISYREDQVRVTVHNTAPVSPPEPGGGAGLAGSGSGLGLATLRQRIELVQGTLHAGPAAGGGFCVTVTLPAYVPTAEPVR
jgi:signal transduction histidine kinase